MVELIFPVGPDFHLCAGFHDLRPWNPTPGQRQYKHEAWDSITPKGAPIKAPEDGDLYIHRIIRSNRGIKKYTQWPSGISYLFSHKYDDGPDHGYGGCLVLYGKSGLKHLIAHIEEEDIDRVAKELGISLSHQIIKHDNEGLIVSIHNLGNSVEVRAGAVIGYVGNRGFSTNPHIHYSIWLNGVRVDPAKYYPDLKVGTKSGKCKSCRSCHNCNGS